MKPALVGVGLLGLLVVLFVLMGGRYNRGSAMEDEVYDMALRDVHARVDAAARELKELREGHDQLLGRIRSLESRPRGLTRLPVGPSASEKLEEDLQEIRELAAALQDPSRAADAPGLETLVVEVLEDRDAREAAARDESRRRVSEDRLNQRIGLLSEQLGLNRYQEEEVRAVLASEASRREQLSRMRDDGDLDRRSLRDEMRIVREETLMRLERVLAPGQYQRYQELESQARGRNRGSDGGGPGDTGVTGGTGATGKNKGNGGGGRRG